MTMIRARRITTRSTSPGTLAVIGALGAICTTHAPGAAEPPNARGAHRPDVLIKTVAPDVVQGQLVSLDLTEGATVTVQGAEERVAAADIVRVVTTATPVAPPPDAVRVSLVGGDMLFADALDGENEEVLLDARDLGRVRIPLDLIERFDLPNAFRPEHRAAVRWLDDDPRRGDEDRVLLTNGDVLRGFVASVSSDSIQLDGTTGLTDVPPHVVVAIRLAATRPASPALPAMTVWLRDGTRLTVTALRWGDDGLSARLPFGPTVTPPVDRVLRAEMVGGRWEWLSAHQPISYEHTPMMALDWPFVVDRNVLGGPIVVAGESFERGVGVHARCSLTYDLKAAYTEFTTRFGLDDRSGPLADVEVEILVDGQRRFHQDDVRRGALLGPVRIDVTRAKRIELIAGFGDNGDIQDRFNWVEAALIR